MGEKLKIGDFGHIIFETKRRIRVKTNGKFHYIKFHAPYDIEGVEVIDVDPKNVWLKGTDGMEYIAERSMIKSFIAEIKPRLN